jgi:hypothetical protein
MSEAATKKGYYSNLHELYRDDERDSVPGWLVLSPKDLFACPISLISLFFTPMRYVIKSFMNPGLLTREWEFSF